MQKAPEITLCRRICTIIIWTLVFTSCLFGTIFIYGPITICFVWPKLYRRLVEIIAAMWQTVIVATNEKIFGVEMVFTGEGVKRHEKTVMLLNHHTRLDWLFYLSYVFHASILNRHKIALKAMLKFIPGIGWAMQTNNYIFLDRNWEVDQEHIRKILTYQIDLNSKPNILFFPEGTDLTKNTIARSNKYAQKHNLPEYEYVLQPRTKGFYFFVNTLREVGGINSVHDVTVGYPYNITKDELEFISGKVPKQVHFHLVRYDIDELPKGEVELSKWIQERWSEKEERLRKFYAEEDPSKRSFSSERCSNISQRSFLLWLALVFWSLFLVFNIYLLIYVPLIRVYAVLMTLLYVSCSYYGGWEKVEMFCYEQLHKPSQLWGKSTVRGGGTGDANPYDKFIKQR